MNRCLPFFSNRLTTGSLAVSDDLAALVCDETLFTRILELERKRADRSGRQSMLMLFSLIRIPDNAKDEDPYKKIFACLAASIRDSDILGWYKSGEVVGIIFTEMGGFTGPAVNSIFDRVKESLVADLPAEAVDNIELSYLLLQGPGHGPEIAFDSFVSDGFPLASSTG